MKSNPKQKNTSIEGEERKIKIARFLTEKEYLALYLQGKLGKKLTPDIIILDELKEKRNKNATTMKNKPNTSIEEWEKEFDEMREKIVNDWLEQKGEEYEPELNLAEVLGIRFKQFITQAIQANTKQVVEKVEGLRIKVPKRHRGKSFCPQCEDTGYNQALIDIIKTLKTPK